MFVPLTTAAELQDWRALFKILRDVQLTEKFERPVDKKYLQRTLGLEEEEERAEREDGLEATKEPEIVSMKEDVNLVLEEETPGGPWPKPKRMSSPCPWAFSF